MDSVARSEFFERERTATLARIDQMTDDLEAYAAAAADSNSDDEHDPEGATLAFEREQATALLARARQQLAEVDEAVTRLNAGNYGRCEHCGGPIDPRRLAARPTARSCIACATSSDATRRGS